jgi:hypothetical protein
MVGTVHTPKNWVIVGLFYPPKQAIGDLFDELKEAANRGGLKFSRCLRWQRAKYSKTGPWCSLGDFDIVNLHRLDCVRLVGTFHEVNFERRYGLWKKATSDSVEFGV